MVPERDVQLPLDLRVFLPVPLDEAEEWPICGAVTQNGRHLVAFRQVIPCGAETLIQLHVVRVEHRVHAGVLQVRAMLQEEVDQVPPPSLQRKVERSVPFEVEPVAALQQERCERVLPALERDSSAPSSVGCL